jgi:hypothetical protein
MKSASTKSLGFLIDELFTTDHKCWEAQERIMDTSLSVEDRLENAIRAQELNNRRNMLIRAIDEIADKENLSPTTKSYHTYFEQKRT